MEKRGWRYGVAVAVLVAVAGTMVGCHADVGSPVGQKAPVLRKSGFQVQKTAIANGYAYETDQDPINSAVTRYHLFNANDQWVATFTQGCYTVVMPGFQRRFRETGRANSGAAGSSLMVDVVHSRFVRIYNEPFNGTFDLAWVQAHEAMNTTGGYQPDVLARVMGFLPGAVAVLDANGKQIAGDAGYGPANPHFACDAKETDGAFLEGSDYHDYLQIAGVGGEAAEPSRAGKVDCSGLIRLLWGYPYVTGGQNTVPLAGNTLTPAAGTLPRKSFQMHQAGPGQTIVAYHDDGKLIADLATVSTIRDNLQVGDLVFFNADKSATDGAKVDHVGMVMGTFNQSGKTRHVFVSSRKKGDGPTMANPEPVCEALGGGGASYLFNAAGESYYWPKQFVGVRRL